MTRRARPNLHAVILAGGAGERFWPASRAQHPKPLLRVMGGHSLLEETIAIDVVIAVYITVLLTMKQQRSAPRAQVVRLAPPTPQPVYLEQPAEPAGELQTQTVRVIAG